MSTGAANLRRLRATMRFEVVEIQVRPSRKWWVPMSAGNRHLQAGLT